MTSKQAANALGVSRQRVMDLLKSGRLQGHKTGPERTDGWEITPESVAGLQRKRVGRPVGWRKEVAQ